MRIKTSLGRSVILLFLLLLVFAAGVIIGRDRGLPLTGKLGGWSIGIYTGPTPFDLSPAPGISNPVLAAENISGMEASLLADPFMVREGERWYMFMEVWNDRTNQGDIGLATSVDALHWTWEQIALDEPFHLSYPLVFQQDDAYYMIPETNRANAVRLYEADPFPIHWRFVGNLIEGAYSDPSIVHRDGAWYLFVEQVYSNLRLFTAPDLIGPWTEHPSSPIYVGDPHYARCGGRIIEFDDKLYRFNQDVAGFYGNQLRAFEITTLSPTDFEERQIDHNPVLVGSGSGWNSNGMHHCDPHQLEDGSWIACVDGHGERRVFGLEY